MKEVKQSLFTLWKNRADFGKFFNVFEQLKDRWKESHDIKKAVSLLCDIQIVLEMVQYGTAKAHPSPQRSKSQVQGFALISANNEGHLFVI